MSDVEANREEPAEQFRIGASLGRYVDVARFDGSVSPQDHQEGLAVAPPLSAGVVQPVGHPVVYVTYFCSIEPSSLAAGVRDGLAKLATFADGHAELQPGAPIVRYRNWRDRTVTIDIGLPIEGLQDLPVDANVTVGRGIDAGPFGRRVARSIDEAITSLREAIAREDPRELADPDPAWQIELADAPTTATSRAIPRSKPR